MWNGANDMFNIGDLIIYSGHGICQIDDICEKTFYDETKKYYVLHPVNDKRLTISTPVDNKSVQMFDLIHKDEAKQIFDSFKIEGVSWIEKDHERAQKYQQMVYSGDRNKISKVVNTLMRRENELHEKDKKLGAQDRKLLATTQGTLFHELALSVNKSYEEVFEKITHIIQS